MTTNRIDYPKVPSLMLCCILCVLSGCSAFGYHVYPTPIDMAIEDETEAPVVMPDKAMAETAGYDEALDPITWDDEAMAQKRVLPRRITDRHIYRFTTEVRNAFRQKSYGKRIGTGIASAVQVSAAAAAATLGGLGGPVGIVTGLSAFAAVIPEIQNIFQFKGAALAFGQGVSMIEEAEGRYLFRATPCHGEIPDNLTRAGSALFVEVFASIKVVDSALNRAIPDLKDLRRASGELREYLFKLALGEITAGDPPPPPQIPSQKYGKFQTHPTGSELSKSRWA